MMTAARSPSMHWEDFTVGTQRSFGSHTLTREEIVRFAAEFDPQPFHLDDAAAAASLFGALSASGWHTCSLVMRMTCDAVLLDAASLGSPGLEQIQWLRPVHVGDTLSVRLDVTEARPMKRRPEVGLTRCVWTAVNQRSEPVLSMQGWLMIGRRAPELPIEAVAE